MLQHDQSKILQEQKSTFFFKLHCMSAAALPATSYPRISARVPLYPHMQSLHGVTSGRNALEKLSNSMRSSSQLLDHSDCMQVLLALTTAWAAPVAVVTGFVASGLAGTGGILLFGGTLGGFLGWAKPEATSKVTLFQHTLRGIECRTEVFTTLEFQTTCIQASPP